MMMGISAAAGLSLARCNLPKDRARPCRPLPEQQGYPALQIQGCCCVDMLLWPPNLFAIHLQDDRHVLDPDVISNNSWRPTS